MLEQRTPEQCVELIWERLGCRVALPEETSDFFARRGRLRSAFAERRRFQRFHFPQKAILERGGKYEAIYTKNLSRTGLMFLYAEQLFPCEEVRVFTSSGLCLPLVLCRCLRLQERCYECGARYSGEARGVMADEQFRALLASNDGTPA